MSERVPGEFAVLVTGVAVILCVVVAGAAASSSAVTPAATQETTDSWVRTVAPASGYDAVKIQIDVAPSGNAEWYIEYRYNLSTDAEVEGFNRTRRNITNPPGAFVTRMENNVVTQARNATGRSMRLEAGSVETKFDVTAGEGVVVYRFTWTNFVQRPSEERVVVGDALGRYDLGADESLMIEWPNRLRRERVSPEPDFDQSNAVRWVGPVTFRTEDPTVVLQITDGGSVGLPVVPALIALVVVLLVAVAWYGRSRWPAGETDDEKPPEPEPSAELLSDEERVLRLLERRDGRMKQQELIEAVDWSRTKASDVVNEMHRAEQIEVFRLGRENVLALPGEIEI